MPPLLVGDDPVVSRVEDERRLRRRLERLNAAPRAPRPDQESQPTESLRRDRQDSSIASLDRLIKRVLPNVNQLRLRLVRSGWSLKIGDYLLLCLAVSAVSGVALAFFLGVSLLVSGLSAIVLGVGLPHMVLSRRIVRRTKRFVGPARRCARSRRKSRSQSAASSAR